MDVWQAIRDDHDAVDVLFDGIAEDNGSRKRLIAELKLALEVHAAGEEAAIYPVLRTIKGLEDVIGHAVEDHAQMRALLARIERAEDDEQMSLVAELEEAVQDHVEVEEEEILPIAEAEIDEDKAAAMLRRFEAAKETARTRT